MNWNQVLKDSRRACTHDARLDIERLICLVRSMSRASMLAHLDDVVTEDDQRMFNELFDRYQVGEPLQYLIGETYFSDLLLKVTPAVLIPRFDTEILVESCLRSLRGLQGPSVCELGTGSGAIAIALARGKKDASIMAVDISAEALDVASYNADRYHVPIQFFRGDLFEPLTGQKFDMVVSNPPYISQEEMPLLDKSVLKEPHLALYGGIDGLDFYKRITTVAPDYLVENGYLAFEIGCRQAKAVSHLMQNQGFIDIEIIKDDQGLDRVVKGRKSNVC